MLEGSKVGSMAGDGFGCSSELLFSCRIQQSAKRLRAVGREPIAGCRCSLASCVLWLDISPLEVLHRESGTRIRDKKLIIRFRHARTIALPGSVHRMTAAWLSNCPAFATAAGIQVRSSTALQLLSVGVVYIILRWQIQNLIDHVQIE